jgi:hypothetical protein
MRNRITPTNGWVAWIKTAMERERPETLTAQSTRQNSRNCPCASSCCAVFEVVVSQQSTGQLLADDFFIQVELVRGRGSGKAVSIGALPSD